MPSGKNATQPPTLPGTAGPPPSARGERNALAAENRRLRTDATSHGATVNELRRKLADAEARFAAREEALRGTGDELRLSLAEARLLAESLEVANTALSERNDRLREDAAEREGLRRDEEHLRLIVESATEYAIFTLDLEGRVTTWNPGARRLFGYAEEEILGRHADVVLTPEDRAGKRIEAEMLRAAQDGHAKDERWHLRADGSRFWAVGTLMPLRGGAGELQGFLKILRDHTDRHRDDERRTLLTDELAHRIKNTLAAVQAVAAQTLRDADISPALQATLVDRLKALGRAHDMLVRNGWQGALLDDVLRQTLAPYTGTGGAVRLQAGGPPVRLRPEMTVTLNLALHELATNAAKYGALSAPGGHVEVTWELERPREGAPAAVILWHERGGAAGPAAHAARLRLPAAGARPALPVRRGGRPPLPSGRGRVPHPAAGCTPVIRGGGRFVRSPSPPRGLGEAGRTAAAIGPESRRPPPQAARRTEATPRSLPPGLPPGMPAARSAAASRRFQSMPVSTPMRRNSQATSSVATLPVAPGAKGQPPSPPAAESKIRTPAAQAAETLATPIP